MATIRSWKRGSLALMTALGFAACSSSTATPPRTAPAPSGGATGQAPAGAARPAGATSGPKPYKDVVTAKAVSDTGIFTVHRIDDKLLFEIPRREFDAEMMMIARAVESTMQDPGGFFGGGAQRLVRWERHGNAIVLRSRSYRLQMDSTENLYRQVRGFQNGPVIARFDVQAWNPAGAAQLSSRLTG